MTVKAAQLTFYIGNKRLLRNTIIDRDNPTPNTPLNLTGMTVKWALSLQSNGQYLKEPVLTKTATITNAVAGECEVLLVNADTTALSPGSYYQEWEVYDPTNETEVVTVGEVVLLLNVTNP